ncbi:MAG: DNA mismatch repair endonuclease MutL [Deltaproteobacteria bacterium]|nr:DNA mismatch repair endonuclease MutL [Deltaproteobacteria bacterium]
MTKIKILPEILSNKIAAGEVVERPASVVKELVENALDAGSSRIIIEVDKGGRTLIRVSDNGAGMSRDDALLAIERYATSKIFKDQDLFAISTLGFRGEALPSIASVSRFSLVTKDEGSAVGTEVVVDGGTVKKVSDIGAPAGTMVSVGQLFFNTPARRKFLKTVNTEKGHIADTVAAFALGRPGVQFKLFHDGKELKSWPAANNPVDRVADVLGKGIANDLHKIEFNDNAVEIAGWVASARITRSTSRGIYIYVNGRFVRDRIIRHALFEGFSGRLMKGQFPMAVLFIKVPYDQVDVNVHPTKYEVRFARQNRVHDAVAGAVSGALRLGDRSEWVTTSSPESRPTVPLHRISETVAVFSRAETGALRSKSAALEDSGALRLREEEDAAAEQAALWKQKQFGDLRVVGQLHNTYILCESSGGLVLIDQHAAHERVLYEQLKKRSTGTRPAAQRLIVPETIDLGYREAQILEKLIPDLNALGLEIEPFGGNTFVVKSVPALLANREISPLVVEIVEKMAEIGFAPGLEKEPATFRPPDHRPLEAARSMRASIQLPPRPADLDQVVAENTRKVV